ncbi:hypothetical protein GW931_01175 [archaeon]|nr:hypothetical protein [archaeon]PJC45503.1 MAG: hypothetical protein CO037_01105 [Candidatus Pacearchaeota archaeon CG_4_9_14_0_2_um_filter_30_8]
MGEVKFGAVEKLSKLNFKSRNLINLSKFEGATPPTVFIGSQLKYPLVNVGILSPIEKVDDASVFDSPKNWAKDNFSIEEVIGLRENLLNSRFQSNVLDVRLNKKFTEIAKEIALSQTPVDIEVELKSKINFGKNSDRVLTPHGMRAELKNARVTGNVKIDKKIDRVMSDEIKSNEGINYLYNSGINEYSLSKILSVGVLGLKKDKKMVPTRWSITATDDIISKEILKKVKGYKWIEKDTLFFGEYLGNQYLIYLFPNIWSYELFEIYYPGSSWNSGGEIKASTDSEGYNGRTNYAKNCAGGYYATRLPILEYLDSIKRQAGVLVIRLETPSYWASLGVWVVRESVRKSFKDFFEFDTREDLLKNAKKIALEKFDFDPEFIYQKSNLLRIYGTQKNLLNWF